jgi:peptide deformylase
MLHTVTKFMEKCMQHFVKKLEGKKLLGRSQQRWKDNIKMYFKEIG